MNIIEFVVDISPAAIIGKTVLFFILLKVFFSSLIFGCAACAKRRESATYGAEEKSIEKPYSIAASVQPVTTLMLATTLQSEALTIEEKA